MSTAQALRRPSFLGRIGSKPRVENAAFKTSGEGRFRPPVLASTLPDHDENDSKDAAAAMAEAQKLAALFTERTSAAVELLRATTERLAAEARTDALEIGFLVARRILEMELSASAEPLVNLVRSAVRRLGESRRIAIHLSPTDAQALGAVIESRGPQAVAQAAISRVEIVADASLSRGDCLVEGDLVTVDGRINARIEELRRVLEASTMENAE
ncbi:MAG TPA: FliH/SctL family protein [Polyangia bacterium]|jgi:flagellar assembly protein FliH